METIKIIVIALVVSSVLLIIFSIIEIRSAKDFCESVKGSYKFSLDTLGDPHFCDDVPIYKSKIDGWQFFFDEEINWSEIEK